MPAAELTDDALGAERPRLLRLARHLVRDPTAAEDATQETLTRAWSRREQLRAGDRVGPWLNRILVNLVIDRSRARRDELDLESHHQIYARRCSCCGPKRSRGHAR